MLGYFISPHDLWHAMAGPNAPQIVDVRRREIYDASTDLIPSAAWREAAAANGWAAQIDRTRPVVVSCKAGHQLSHMAAAQLRAEGVDARVLEVGYDVLFAWIRFAADERHNWLAKAA
jgi:rhodanese-related sulfurtransferase